MKKIALFIATFLLWFLLVWPLNPQNGALQMPDIIVGLVVALVVTLIMREFTVQRFRRLVNPVRYLWIFAYAAIFIYYLVKANLDVAYRILHPAMPIEPGIVKVRTNLKTATAITTLANSITLTPGTLTVDITDDGYLYVHWINVKTKEGEKAAQMILGRFEWFIKKIFE
jgi:multicomponent Na+:H+ antiporter subunit E